VFLFEQNIIFSEAVGKKTQFTNPVYIHKAHIQVSHLGYNHLHKLRFSCGKSEKVMVRFSPEQAMKALRWSSGIALLCL